MEILWFIIGTFVVPGLVAVAVKINPATSVKNLALLISKYIGLTSANKLTNAGAYFLISVAHSILTSIPDDDALNEVAKELGTILSKMNQHI